MEVSAKLRRKPAKGFKEADSRMPRMRLASIERGNDGLVRTADDTRSRANRNAEAARRAEPDAGEPMGAAEAGRPAMLGRRFRLTVALGMLVGLTLALVGNALVTRLWISRDTSGWTWLITAIGGIAVGGALTLFIYGVSTDRTDTGPKRRGRADVTTEGEERRSRRRRALRGR